MILSSLCYLEKDGKYLMLHRTKKKNDINEGKWLGIGGKFEQGESPEECIIREVKEETGYTLVKYELRGIMTYVSEVYELEYIFIFTASQFTGEEIECNEGDLKWIKKEEVLNLPTWEGDKIFLKNLIEDKKEFFSIKYNYDKQDKLINYQLKEYKNK